MSQTIHCGFENLEVSADHAAHVLPCLVKYDRGDVRDSRDRAPDALGVPVLPPYYTLRLLPYVMPNITGWRRSMLRERDLTDLCDQEIT